LSLANARALHEDHIWRSLRPGTYVAGMAKSRSSWFERLAALQNRFLDWARSPKADTVATAPPSGRFEDFGGRKYCVLVTYKKNGDPVPSPLWFGVGNGKLYAHTAGVKIKRIQRNPEVRVAPSTFRGRPTSAPITGTARVLSSGAENDAEKCIQANYGVQRRMYNRMLGDLDTAGVYVEITPTP
jgi:PPOX class probable F420-dependent enzyme